MVHLSCASEDEAEFSVYSKQNE